MYQQKVKTLLAELSRGLFERDQELRLVLLSMLSGKSIFLYGPPGVAKSQIARSVAKAFSGENQFFAYLMNRFSTPEEIFGPIDIAELKKNNLKRKVDGYLPTADFAFLDEIWKSSPAILNTLLTIINERIYRDGNTDLQVPLKGIVCASNEFPPDNQGLEALYDRMVIRYCVKPIESKQNFTNLITGVIPESSITQTFSLKDYEDIAARAKTIKFSKEALEAILQLKAALNDYKDFAQAYNIDLPQDDIAQNDISSEEAELSQAPTLEAKDLYISDRRWKQCAELLQVAAVLSDRESVEKYDIVLLKHCLWNTELAKIFVDKVFETIFHTQANPKVANAQTQLETLETTMANELYQKNGTMKKNADTARINHYRILCEAQAQQADSLKSEIQKDYETKQARIANPFLSKEDIQSYLTTYTKDLTTINNIALKAQELIETLNEKKTLESIAATIAQKNTQNFKHFPKNKDELMNMVRNPRISLAEIDISEVSDMSYLFKECYRGDFSGIEAWDVSHVTNMEGMFQNAETFNADISQWDVSSVTNMKRMFQDAVSFNQPLDSWDVSHVTNMERMFQNAVSFNQPLGSWDVSNVEDMSHMFNSARKFNQPLDSWDIRKAAKNKSEGSAFLGVTTNGLHGMFNFSAQHPMPQWFSKAK